MQQYPITLTLPPRACTSTVSTPEAWNEVPSVIQNAGVRVGLTRLGDRLSIAPGDRVQGGGTGMEQGASNIVAYY